MSDLPNQLDQPVSAARRHFLCNVSVGAAAIVASACGGSGPSDAAVADTSMLAAKPVQQTTVKPGVQQLPPNLPPVWSTVPTIQFTKGIPARISIAAYVSDPEKAALMITKNSVALPQGVTYDVATQSFVYDGVGNVAATSGHILTAQEV